jgi:hypothetical protein
MLRFQNVKCNRVSLGSEVVAATARQAAPPPPLKQQWLEYGKYLVIGCYGYFDTTIIQHLARHLLLYKAARLCHPFRMAELRVSAETVRDILTDAALLEFAPFVGSLPVDELILELGTYKAAVEDFAGEPAEMASKVLPRIMKFWAGHRRDLPRWGSLARLFATILPSSAAAERAFSILQKSCGDQQAHALEDYVAASCLLQFNKRVV